MKSLRENWMIVLFIGGLVISWTMFSTRLTTAEGKIAELTTTNEQIKQIQIDVAIIQEKISSENIKLQVRQGVAEALQGYERVE